MNSINTTILKASDSTSQSSSVVDGLNVFSASFQASFSDGAAAGTLQVQASNDIPPSNYSVATFSPSNWTNVSNGSATVTAGASVLVSLPQTSYRFMRVIWTPSAGSGTITCNVCALGY